MFRLHDFNNFSLILYEMERNKLETTNNNFKMYIFIDQ